MNEKYKLTKKMKLIHQYNPKISIWADALQYVLRIKSKANDHEKHASNYYFPNLEYCLEELYEQILRRNLADPQATDLQNLILVVKSTHAEFMNHLKSINQK
jgi:hypothetical protein